MDITFSAIFKSTTAQLSAEEKTKYNELSRSEKLFFFFSIAIAGTCTILFYLILSIVNNSIYQITNSIICLFFYSSVFLFLRFSKNISLIGCYTTIVILGSLCLLFFEFGLSTIHSFWILFFPFVAIYSLSKLRGSLFSLLLFAFIICIYFLYPSNTHHFSATSVQNFSFLLLEYICAYLVAIAICHTIELGRRNIVIQTIKQNQTIKELQERTDLIVTLSHQIRTPLNSILGITNLLKTDNLKQEQAEYLDAINTSVLNLSLTLNTMTDITKDKKDSDQDIKFYFDINDLVEHSVQSFKDKYERNTVNTLSVISEYIPHQLTGNTKKIEQILEKIFETIVLHSKRNEASFEIYINNKKETNTAIELLFEIHTSSLRSGIEEAEFSLQHNSAEAADIISHSSYIDLFDLSDAKHIIESFGGMMGHKRLDNSINVFWFTMILWKSQISEEQKDLPKAQKVIDLCEASVLIVEDNLMNQKFLSLSLETLVKSIEIANNGKEALKLFESSKFDIILMDIQMPILDGYKTTAKIRVSEIGTNFHVPIIALTANVMHGEMEKCLAYGMDDYISKPFQMETLIEKLNLHLGKA